MIRILSDILCATEDQDPYGVFEYHMSGVEYDLRNEIGDEAFEELKKEVEAKKAAEKAEIESGKAPEKGTILDRFDKKLKNDPEPDAAEDTEHKDIEVNKDQIVL